MRIYIDENVTSKGLKGGFAVGGFNSSSKGITNDYLRITPDTFRIYIDDTGSSKGLKGGFAVGGYGSSTKELTNEYLRVSPDSVRIYVDNNPVSKGLKGGFAVGGFNSSGKGYTGEYFNISGESAAGIINPSQSRVLWYPNKEAFLTGRVLIESPDSVGMNSMATGYESKSIGDCSQALGLQLALLR